MLQNDIIYGQDSLSIKQLAPITYTFNIENGVLKGKGAKFLIKEMTQAQFTMIGEYHGSMRISEFTKSIIPILDSVGYKTMVLEVGPISGQILNGLNLDAQKELRKINEKYLIPEKNDTNLPIPFFENIEDAAFLVESKQYNWNVIGIDQEFMFGYKMLIDLTYDNLPNIKKSSYKEIFKQTSDSLTNYYKRYVEDNANLFEYIKSSKVLNEYFTKVSSEPKNIEIIKALKASNEIYWLFKNKQWFENNSTRVNYMKEQLRRQLTSNNFDLSKDKLLIKMGGFHLSKGFSPLRLYEVGNTLNEISEYYGNKSLNITFSSRYYVENNEVFDILNSDNEYFKNFRDLNQMGKENEWVVIDLRPLIKGHFYNPIKYKFNEHIEDLIKRYDLLIIPKTEISPIPNYRKE